jgi:ABC-type glycerol-3-phosphate transport system permease component
MRSRSSILSRLGLSGKRLGPLQRALRIFLAHLPLAVGGVILMLPLLWMLSVSLMTPGQAQQATSGASLEHWIPSRPQWGNYSQAMQHMGAARRAEEMLVEADESSAKADYPPLAVGLLSGDVDPAWGGFFDALANSVVITACVVFGTVLSCSLVGYAFARLRFRGSKTLFIIMLSTMMLPGQVTMIPVFLLFRSLGWVDTFLPLIVPAFFGNAFFIFMFRQFFLQIPQDLLDAAKIDGAGHFGIWWRIMLPMSKPVVIITAIFTFLSSWNDFLGPLIYLHSPENGTLALALNSFKSQFTGVSNVNLLMASSIITMLPCILLFFVAQRHFVKGLNLGAVKG